MTYVVGTTTILAKRVTLDPVSQGLVIACHPASSPSTFSSAFKVSGGKAQRDEERRVGKRVIVTMMCSRQCFRRVVLSK